jgi:hypothetical protein
MSKLIGNGNLYKARLLIWGGEEVLEEGWYGKEVSNK